MAKQDIATFATTPAISDKEFNRIRCYLHEIAGIHLAPSKKTLVTSRLARRLRHYSLTSYSQYMDLLTDTRHPGEQQMMLDLLTTNETYFFREPGHLDFLRDQVLPLRPKNTAFRVWSAASSTGEEAYSVSMILAHHLNAQPWEIIGTDINAGVLNTARGGHYSMARIDAMPQDYLHKYCLRGTGPQEGTLLIDASLRQNVKFQQANLNRDLPDLGMFDVIFLRNVLIYFNMETKREIVARVIRKLKPGGHFFIGHSETLNGVDDTLKRVAPTTYAKL